MAEVGCKKLLVGHKLGVVSNLLSFIPFALHIRKGIASLFIV
jgi:hypothetical protein